LIDREAYRAAAPLVTKLNVVTADTVRDKSREVAAVVRAIMLASRDFARDPALWADAMEAARPDVTREQLLELAKAYRDSWSVDGGLDETELATTTSVLYKSEEFKGLPSIAPSEWIDRRFIENVIREFGSSRPTRPE
jgi:NitT/TauT family transport system substrate-binding protein